MPSFFAAARAAHPLRVGQTVTLPQAFKDVPAGRYRVTMTFLCAAEERDGFGDPYFWVEGHSTNIPVTALEPRPAV